MRSKLSQVWENIQYRLFPDLEDRLGLLSEKHKLLISILELIRIEQYITPSSSFIGRPSQDRAFLARAFVAKIVFKLTYTNQLREYIRSDKQLRLICGWDSVYSVPSESKFSRVFQEFSETRLPERVHEELIKEIYKGEIIGHVIKDSSPVIAREQAVVKKQEPLKEKVGRGKHKRGVGKKVKAPTRIEKQASGHLAFEEMLKDLPKDCNFGKKKKPGGYNFVWKGYKLHLAVDDHCVPLAAILTSASLNDHQVAIPLAIKTAKVVTNFYDLMDSGYDVPGIIEHSKSLGHVPIIDKKNYSIVQKQEKIEENKRRKILGWEPAERKRYRERCEGERTNALIKEYYGGEKIQYKGHSKVFCHLMFGLLTVAGSLLLNLV